MTTDIEHQDQDQDVVPVIDGIETIPDQGVVGDFISEMAGLAKASAGGPLAPIARGTFAAYPMEDGGIMFVTNVEDGPLAGVKHNRIKPGLIRAISVLAGGGGKLAALRAMIHE